VIDGGKPEFSDSENGMWKRDQGSEKVSQLSLPWGGGYFCTGACLRAFQAESDRFISGEIEHPDDDE
jgi:hypothetical protein